MAGLAFSGRGRYLPTTCPASGVHRIRMRADFDFTDLMKFNGLTVKAG